VRILITGASGFVGSHLAASLSREHRVLGTFRNARRTLPFPSQRIDLTDTRGTNSLIESFRPEVIVHSAACSKVIECEDDPATAIAVNIDATARLVLAAERSHAKLVYLSSDQVFSGEKGGYRESDTPEPRGRYGATKLEAEGLVLSSSAKTLIVRSNSVVGRSLGFGESFTDMLVGRLGNNESVSLFADQYRSPIHIRVMVEILTAACLSDLTGLLHAGGPRRMNRLDIGYAIARAYGLSADLIESASYLTHSRASIMTRDTSFDISRLRQVFSPIKQRSLDEEFLDDAKEAGVLA
jgi:dTDP-4-dehydrorhamnose reductase